MAAALEALVAKDVRRALGMFGDIIVSPHIPTGQITSTLLGGEQRIQEYRIIRALMSTTLAKIIGFGGFAQCGTLDHFQRSRVRFRASVSCDRDFRRLSNDL